MLRREGARVRFERRQTSKCDSRGFPGRASVNALGGIDSNTSKVAAGNPRESCDAARCVSFLGYVFLDVMSCRGKFAVML